MFHRLSWALTGALGIVLVLALARVISAGPLDPPGPVGSTMRKLDELVPAWDQNLSSSGGYACSTPRFQCVMVFNDPFGDAVLDRETGLVWEKAPSTTTYSLWSAAQDVCKDRNTGGRQGWRLPTLYEGKTLLGTFVDPSVIRLPAGHPFQIDASIGAAAVFATTTQSRYVTLTYRDGFKLNGGRDSRIDSSVFPRFVWCVRGEAGETQQ